MDSRPLVYVIDDDPSMRSLIEATVQGMGATAKSFASASEFIGQPLQDQNACVLLDLEMPGLSGLDFLEKHFAHKIDLPVIIITAHASVQAAVRSLKMGAVDFLEKPFEREILVKAVERALEKDRLRRSTMTSKNEIRRRLATLSPRESELLRAVVEGKSTKMIADELGISPRTVDHHRANLMEKMRAANVADLVRMTVEAGELPKPTN
jgi:two-component system, LuxR family, response regulator FixJ